MSPRSLQARDLLVSVNRADSNSVGRQIEEQLRIAVQSGALAAGTLLPSTRALAEDLGVSRGVVVRAYTQLAAEGYLLVRQGANPTVRAISLRADPQAATPQVTRSKIRYDLRAHFPEVGTFPRKRWLQSVRDSLHEATNADLSYGDHRGMVKLRTEVASYLGRARGVVADPERIVITAGATHALSLLGRVLARRGLTRMAFENPSHFILHGVAEWSGQTLVAVPVDREGIRADLVGDAPSVVVSPAHQFPTGVALSPERRARLISWAQDTGGLIVEDDYDAEFRYDRAPIGSLQGLSPEHALYIGSTGKTLVPALRLGWAVVPSNLLDDFALELARSMIHVSSVDQMAFADFLRRGEFDRHLRRMRAIYRSRRDTVMEVLTTCLPELGVSGIAAGLHVVIELSSPTMEAAAQKAAFEAGLLVESLGQHALPGYTGPAGILVGYGHLSEPTLRTAAQQLASAIATAGS